MLALTFILMFLTLIYTILQSPRTQRWVRHQKDYGQCSKKTKIAFLKTHKCASSSVQNMLMRFGLENELNFVLPSVGNYLGR